MALRDLKKKKEGFSDPFAGTIRLGEKIKKKVKGREVEMPTGTETFIIKGDTEGENAVIAEYGNTPKELVVFFPPFKSQLKESDFQSNKEYKDAYVEEWTDKAMTVRYTAYGMPSKGSTGGSLLFYGDDNGGKVKDSDFYNKLFGKYPEDEMPTGGWKIELGEGQSWDDHEKFQELLEKKTITTTATIKFWVKNITASGVFRIVTHSKSIMSGFYQYIDSLSNSGIAPFMVATKLSKKQISIKKNGSKMNPWIMEFEQCNDWAELGIEHIETIKKKREPVQKLIASMYGTKEIMGLNSSASDECNMNAIEEKVKTYELSSEVVADEMDDEVLMVNIEPEIEVSVEEEEVEQVTPQEVDVIENGKAEVIIEEGEVKGVSVKKGAIKTEKKEVKTEKKEVKTEKSEVKEAKKDDNKNSASDEIVYDKQYLTNFANKRGVSAKEMKEIIAQNQKGESESTEDYIKGLCNIMELMA